MTTTMDAPGKASAPPSRYPALVGVAHWLTVLAVAAAYLLVEFGEGDEAGALPLREP